MHDLTMLHILPEQIFAVSFDSAHDLSKSENEIKLCFEASSVGCLHRQSFKENSSCRCLAALAEWSRLTNECRKEWKHAEPHVRRDMAGLAAHAAWHMGQWEEMAAYTHEMRTNDTSTGSFLLAVQAVHNQNLDAATGECFSLDNTVFLPFTPFKTF